MKILLIYPNDYLEIGISPGLATLSAVLKKHGHQVELFDFTFIKEKDIEKSISENYNRGLFLPTEYTIEDLVADDPVQLIEDAFRQKINDYSPELIAISTMTGNFDKAIGLLNKIKTCQVVVGGVHATIFPQDALSFDVVDFVCIGEGEKTLPELCECLEKNKDFSSIKNLGYLKNGHAHINACRPFVDLDDLPTPDWSIFDKRHLFRPFMGKIYKGSFYAMSRGCPFECSYCVNGSLKKMLKDCGRYFRYQSPSATVNQIKTLKELYGATWFKLADDSITLLPDSYLEELALGLKNLNINFGCSIRPETVTPKKVELLKSMGCVAASVGVESGNESLRKSVLNRHMTDEQIVKAISILKEANIRVSTFNMIGLPGETREDVFKTISLNRKLNAESVNVYIIYPYPGTGIYKKYKINIHDVNGNIVPVSKASSFALSKMPPGEVEGLLKTFDLYLRMPEEKWPQVRQAETNDQLVESLYNSINH